MIKRITEHQTVSKTVANFCQQLECHFNGDIDISYSTRISLATDNSIYQAIPQAVLFPKCQKDIETLTKLAQENEYKEIRFSPRGGGTGTNGQSLTEHVIIDLSRHMRNILEINVEQGWVRVETGVIKDQLNDFLRPYGFFFAPDLSTSNRATIGGMINTDASGQGSLVYGKTSDHILGLKSVLLSGEVLETTPIPVKEAKEKALNNDSEGMIYRQVLDTCTQYRDKIKSVFPRLNRFLTGYDLEHVLNDDMSIVDLSRILAGSEGTLAFITEAKLNITPIAKYKTLINIKYDSFDSALRNSPFLVEAKATSVETVDSKVLNLAKQDIVWDTVSDLIQEVPNQIMDGLNIVEFNDEQYESQVSKVESLCHRLDDLIKNKQQGVIGYQLTTDLASINRIYAMRKKAVGLLGNAKSSKKPIAFVEDTAVPPENLADFITEFKAILDSYNLDYGMFGHVDAGVLHVRPALDLSDPDQEKLLRTISDKVVKLTAKYGGLMWGEHGKGYRSEYGPEFFGEELFLQLRKIKACFDQEHRLNPGKICTPYNSDEELVSVDGVKRAHFDKTMSIPVKAEYETTVNCNGNGLCFSYDTSSPMCPSYKATKDRRNSPKGRASLMREWLRLQQKEGKQDFDVHHKSFWVNKVLNTLGKKLGQQDFSHEVKNSMDLCLACKACTTACPIKVDVPTFRSKFLALYHQRYLRPLSDYLVANVEKLLPLMAFSPRLTNLFANNPISKKVIETTLGYVDAPRISRKLTKLVDKQHFYSEKLIKRLPQELKEKAVFIVQDAFTTHYEAELVKDTVDVLNAIGYHPIILPFKPNGKPSHVKGFADKFIKTARKSTRFFNQIAKLEIPMIGLDASMVFAYRDEYVKALGQDKVKFNVYLLSEWLAKQSFAVTSCNDQHENFVLLNHCTEKSILASSAQDWQNIAKKFGIALNPKNTGCCGMAGTFGHEKANQEISKSLYDLSWSTVLEKHGVNQVVATGFSCRCQVKRYEQQKIQHPIQLIANSLTRLN